MGIFRTFWVSVVVVIALIAGVLIGTDLDLHTVALSGQSHSIVTLVGESSFVLMSYWVLVAVVAWALTVPVTIFTRVRHEPAYLLYKDLFAVALGLAGVYGVLIVLVRDTPYRVFEVVVPGLSRYEPMWVVAAQIAVYVILAAVLCRSLRRHIGFEAWRGSHVIMVLSFLAALSQSLLTEAVFYQSWTVWVHAVATSVVVFLVVERFYDALKARRLTRH